MVTVIEHLLDVVFDSFLVVGVCVFFGWIAFGGFLGWRSGQTSSLMILMGIACLVLAVSDYYAISVLLGSLWGFVMIGGLDGSARSFANGIKESYKGSKSLSHGEYDKETTKAEADIAALRELAVYRKHVNPDAYASQIAAQQEKINTMTDQRREQSEVADILEYAEKNLSKYRFLPNTLTIMLGVSLASFALLVSTRAGQDLLTGGYLSRREEEELIILGFISVLFAGICSSLYRGGWKNGDELDRTTGLAHRLGIIERSWQDQNEQILLLLKHDLSKPNRLRNLVFSIITTLFSVVSMVNLVD